MANEELQYRLQQEADSYQVRYLANDGVDVRACDFKYINSEFTVAGKNKKHSWKVPCIEMLRLMKQAAPPEFIVEAQKLFATE